MSRFLLTLSLVAVVQLLQAQTLYYPPTSGTQWDTLAPSDLNWCPDKIDSLQQYLEDEETRSFLILKDGKIVLEWYLNGFKQDSSWFWFSAGKSLMATLVGQAQEQGLLNIQDKTSDHLGTGWTSLPALQEDSITVWHQLTMSSGLDEQEFACTDDTCLTYFAPVGTRWVYHNSPYTLLGNVIEAASGQTINQYTNALENQIGMSGFWLPLGYNRFYLSPARDMARFGLLIQGGGQWDGQTVLTDTSYLNDMLTTSQLMNPAYGYLWWLNGKSSFIGPDSPISFPGAIAPDAPSDIYTAAGSQGQFISISPSTGLMMIRQGSSALNSLAPINLLNDIWKRILDLECDNTGLAELTESRVTVFPNPTTGKLRFSEPANGLVRDVTGRTVRHFTNTASLDLLQLPRGLYVVELHTGDAFSQHKVLLR